MMSESGPMRLVFGYEGGEKSVISAENITREQITEICNSVANSTSDFIMLDIPTEKHDIILINKRKLIFFYATPKDIVAESSPSRKSQH